MARAFETLVVVSYFFTCLFVIFFCVIVHVTNDDAMIASMNMLPRINIGANCEKIKTHLLWESKSYKSNVMLNVCEAHNAP